MEGRGVGGGGLINFFFNNINKRKFSSLNNDRTKQSGHEDHQDNLLHMHAKSCKMFERKRARGLWLTYVSVILPQRHSNIIIPTSTFY